MSWVFERWLRRLLAASPPWLPRVLVASLLVLPVLGFGGYALVGGSDGRTGTPLEELDADLLYQDTDNDALPDLLETYVYGTDPNRSRTASGVVPDGYLARHGYDPADPASEKGWAAYPGPGGAPDAWGSEGLPPAFRLTVEEVYTWNRPEDYDENVSGPWQNELDPTEWRSPSGLPVPWLINVGLDPLDPGIGERVLDPAPEGDGLSVEESYRTATDPYVTDTDGDGIPDDVELSETGTDPSRFATSGGGIADGWALSVGLDPTDPAMPHEDPDRDGLTNAREFNASVQLFGLDAVLNGTSLDPNARSSGGSPIPDGWLAEQRLDPLAPGIERERLHCASDHDGEREPATTEDLCLDVQAAYAYNRPDGWDEARDGPWFGGLSARTNDSDGDGLPDAVEIRGWQSNLTTSPTADAEPERVELTSDPLSRDTDGDGLTDREEYEGMTIARDVEVSFPPTDPKNRDTDFDQLSDGREVLVMSQQLSERLGEPVALDPTVRDSDGDSLPDGVEWSILRNRADQCRSGEATYGFTNPTRSIKKVLAQIAEDQGLSLPDNADGVCDLLEPWGDPDGDGIVTILDQDADNDGLLDGWEAIPSNYDQSPFASEHPRPRTDLVNPDSDGDLLPDAWETKHGIWDLELEGWNLDPSRWSSFQDDVSDADRDLDGDGTTWYTFHREPQGVERVSHRFEATNLVEFRNGTDPNRASTSGTGLTDGWAIFWGRVYPDLEAEDVGDIYPGAPGPLFIPPGTPKPSPVTGEDETVSSEPVLRFSTSSEPLEGETLDRVFENVQDSQGQTRTVYRFEHRAEETFLLAQAHGTNPYLRDTDGDGGADAWEIVLLERSGEHPDPIRSELGSDTDDDGLPFEREAEQGTDPTLADTDLGGISDGDELSNGRDPLNPRDDSSVSDPDSDLDCDGVRDVEEVDGWQHPTRGNIRTNPANPDGDTDGLLDGFDLTLDPAKDEDTACIARLRLAGILETSRDDGTIQFLGEASHEADPNLASTAQDGVPDGYRAYWGLKATDTPTGIHSSYEATRPAWWSEATMGPWLWGPAPSTGQDVDRDGVPDTRMGSQGLELVDEDLDEDGLNDWNGEDPTPGARPELIPPQGFPTAQAPTDTTSLAQARAFGLDKVNRSNVAGRDRDGDGIADVHDRLPARITALDLEGAESQGGVHQLAQTGTFQVSGRVVADTGASTVPAHNATVVIELNGHEHPLAAAFTRADGTFRTNVSLAGPRAVEIPEGLVYAGRTGTTIHWTPSLDGVPPGPGPPDDPNVLRVWVTNTSGAALPEDPTYLGIRGQMKQADGTTRTGEASGIHGSSADPLPVSLVIRPELSLSAPSTVHPGEQIEIETRLTTGAGDAIANRTIELQVDDITETRETDETGSARFPIQMPPGPPRTVSVHARSLGDDIVKSANQTVELRTKHATSIAIDSVQPNPGIEGQNLTIRGRLIAPAEGSDDALGVRVEAFSSSRTVTLASGVFETDIPAPTGVAGTSHVTVLFNGTTTLAATQVRTPIQVVGGASLDMSLPSTVSPGERITIEGTLTDAQGVPLTGSPILFDGVPAPPAPTTTDQNGRFETTWPAPSHPGTWQLTATFQGTETRAPAHDDDWLSVSIPSRLELDAPPTLVRGSLASLDARLVDANGTALQGQAIQVELAGEVVASGISREDGRVTPSWRVAPGLELGSAILRVSFNGSLDNRYEATVAETTVTIEQGLRVDPIEPVLQRGPNLLDIKVRLDTGEPPPPGQLQLHAPELGIQELARLDGDRASFEIDLPVETRLGDYSAAYGFEPEDPTIPNARVNTTLHVTSASRLELRVPTTAPIGDTLRVGATLADDQGEPAGTGTLSLQVAGVEATLDLIEGHGQTTIAIPETVEPGPARIQAHWPGDARLEPATQAAHVSLLRPAELHTEMPTSVAPGQTVRGSVQLLDSSGQPLEGRKILIREGEEVSYLVETDEDGRATLVLNAPDANATAYEISFAGDASHAGSTAHTAVHVQAPAEGSGTLTMLGLAALPVLGLVAGYVLYRKRRELVESAIQELDEGRRRLEAGSPYEATIIRTYDALVDLIARQDVHAREEETLREYQEQIERALDLRGPEIQGLFDLFEQTFYGPATPGPRERREAVDCFRGVALTLQRRLEGTRQGGDAE